MVTKRRELRLAVSDIFKAYHIDNLQLEIDITSKAIEIIGLSEEDEMKRVGTEEALARHEKIRESSTVDVSHFPEDVSGIASFVCDLWSIKPPMRRKGSEYSRWIDCCRDIEDACGEFGIEEVLSSVKTDYDEKVQELYGIVPYTVSGPCALIKTCRAKAAQMRERNTANVNTSSGTKQSSFHI